MCVAVCFDAADPVIAKPALGAAVLLVLVMYVSTVWP